MEGCHGSRDNDFLRASRRVAGFQPRNYQFRFLGGFKVVSRSVVGDAEIEAGYRLQRIVEIRTSCLVAVLDHSGNKVQQYESWIVFGGRRGPSTTVAAYLLG